VNYPIRVHEELERWATLADLLQSRSAKEQQPDEAIFEMARQVRPDDTAQAISLRGEVPFHSTPSLVVVPQEVI
jgi:hypothetical protein